MRKIQRKWFPTEAELGVPEQPAIFKTNVFMLKNKTPIFIVIFAVLVIPIFYISIEGYNSSSMFVDYDITKFRLEKTRPFNSTKDDHAPTYGIFHEESTSSQRIDPDLSKVTEVKFAMTSCDRISLENAVVSIKSMVLSALNYGVRRLECHIFIDSESGWDDAKTALSEIKKGISWSSMLTFSYKIHDVGLVLPSDSFHFWINMYKKCSAVRLFIAKAIPEVKEILFLETDTLILGDIRGLWSQFSEMDKAQFAGLALDQVSGVTSSFYQIEGRIPFVPPTGVNAGVMLLNLTRMRQFDWELKVNNVLESFAHDLVRGDQDIINIIFYFNREYLKIIPCLYNYRKVDCNVVQRCEEANTHPDGIQILHGNANGFAIDGHFRTIYELYRKFDLSRGDFKRDIVKQIKWHYTRLTMRQKSFNSGCIAINFKIFKSWDDDTYAAPETERPETEEFYKNYDDFM